MQHPTGSRQGRELRSGQAPEENSGAVVQTNENAGRMPALQNGGAPKRALQKKNAPTGKSGRTFLQIVLYSKTRICQVDNLMNRYPPHSLRVTARAVCCDDLGPP